MSKYEKFGQKDVKAIAELIEAGGRGGRFRHIASMASTMRAEVAAEKAVIEAKKDKAPGRAFVQAWHAPKKDPGPDLELLSRL